MRESNFAIDFVHLINGWQKNKNRLASRPALLTVMFISIYSLFKSTACKVAVSVYHTQVFSFLKQQLEQRNGVTITETKVSAITCRRCNKINTKKQSNRVTWQSTC